MAISAKSLAKKYNICVPPNLKEAKFDWLEFGGGDPTSDPKTVDRVLARNHFIAVRGKLPSGDIVTLRD